MGSFAFHISNMTRRLFLKIAGGAIFMAAIPSSVYGFFVRALPVRTVEKGRFKFNTDKGIIEWERGSGEEYRLVVDGLIKEPKTFSYVEIKSFTQVEQVSDFHCVEGWSVKDINGEDSGSRRSLTGLNRIPRATIYSFIPLERPTSNLKGKAII